MENEVKPAVDFYRLVAWAHANRKRLIWIAAAIVIIGGTLGIYTLYKSNRETEANNALSEINGLAIAAEAPNAAAAEPYLKVAADYPGTSAGARALLLAGGVLFDAGKFQDARRQFERFLGDYPDYPLADQALMGVAKCYEGEGNLTEAATRYKDFTERHPSASALPDAKSALARVYLAEKKPEQALQEYEELLRARNNDSWTAEAGIQREELLNKYPQLRKQTPPPTTSQPPAITMPMMPPKIPTPAPASSNLSVPSTKPAKP